jgi:hypothetical protein
MPRGSGLLRPLMQVRASAPAEDRLSALVSWYNRCTAKSQSLPLITHSKVAWNAPPGRPRHLCSDRPRDIPQTEEKESMLVKTVWASAVGGTTAIFGYGIFAGQNLLIPAWAWFHAVGATGSALKRQGFEVFMHCAMLVGIGSFAAGWWGQHKGKPVEPGSK